MSFDPTPCENCRIRHEVCRPSTASRGDRRKCESCRLRRVECVRRRIAQPERLSTSSSRPQRSIPRPNYRLPSVVESDEVIFQGMSTINSGRYSTRSPPPPPNYLSSLEHSRGSIAPEGIPAGVGGEIVRVEPISYEEDQTLNGKLKEIKQL